MNHAAWAAYPSLRWLPGHPAVKQGVAGLCWQQTPDSPLWSKMLCDFGMAQAAARLALPICQSPPFTFESHNPVSDGCQGCLILRWPCAGP